MSVGVCSICGKFTKAGGLCYKHGKAMYDANEKLKWEMEEFAFNMRDKGWTLPEEVKNEKQEGT